MKIRLTVHFYITCDIPLRRETQEIEGLLYIIPSNFVVAFRANGLEASSILIGYRSKLSE